LINARRFSSQRQVKVIPLLRNTHLDCLPYYLRDRVNLDFSEGSNYSEKIIELIGSIRGDQEQPAGKTVLHGEFAQKPPPAVSNNNNIANQDRLPHLPELEMVSVPSGSYIMGSKDGFEDERPLHKVIINDSFEIMKYTVTQDEFDQYLNASGYGSLCNSDLRRSQWPAIVSWNDADGFAGWMSECTGETYRLPTEEQWEYVCRAGQQTDFHWGNKCDSQKANFNLSEGGILPVGRYDANPLGVCDMHGNVWEWCDDLYGFYHCEDQQGDFCPVIGKERVLRGGDWNCGAQFIRCSSRFCLEPWSSTHDTGFRLVRQKSVSQASRIDVVDMEFSMPA
jgi:formylglycine-generating enzyme required for sulfatase activity